MQLQNIFAAAVALLATTGAALQVNWYSDHNCGNYIDSTYFSGKGIHGNEQNGQPAGAGSALFVTQDGNCGIYGCNSPYGGCGSVSVGQCISFPDGTWVSSDC